MSFKMSYPILNQMKPKTDKPKPKQVVKFKATIGTMRFLKDGGITVTLDLSEQEYITVALLASLKNQVLDVIIAPETDTTEFGGRE